MVLLLPVSGGCQERTVMLGCINQAARPMMLTLSSTAPQWPDWTLHRLYLYLYLPSNCWIFYLNKSFKCLVWWNDFNIFKNQFCCLLISFGFFDPFILFLRVEPSRIWNEWTCHSAGCVLVFRKIRFGTHNAHDDLSAPKPQPPTPQPLQVKSIHIVNIQHKKMILLCRCKADLFKWQPADQFKPARQSVLFTNK